MLFINFPAGIYLLKVYNRDTRKRCEVCLKLTIKRHQNDALNQYIRITENKINILTIVWQQQFLDELSRVQINSNEVSLHKFPGDFRETLDKFNKPGG